MQELETGAGSKEEVGCTVLVDGHIVEAADYGKRLLTGTGSTDAGLPVVEVTGA